MKAEIISIGSELLLGHIINSNAAYISRKLAEIGIDVRFHTSVGDNMGELSFFLRQALGRSEIVIATGGLGPTVDDITLECILKTLKKKTVFNPRVLKRIKAHFQARHIKMPKCNLRQAYVPKGAIALKNDVGTAPGLIIKEKGKILIALPGVPNEMMPMIERDCITYLRKFAPKKVIISKVIHTTGLAESDVNTRVKQELKGAKNIAMGIYVHTASVDLKITAAAKDKLQAQKLISAFEKKLRKKLGIYVFGADHETLEGVVGELLFRKKKTLAIAESCTGGLISRRITDIPGASKYFLLGLTLYSNKSKTIELGIPAKTIQKYGAVSEIVAKQMAFNIRKKSGADFGISVTGIAGPAGATKNKPLGLIYIAFADKKSVDCEEYHFTGDRESIRLRASQFALDLLRRHLLVIARTPSKARGTKQSQKQ